MFIKTSNGYLLNTNNIKTIYIKSSNVNDKFNTVTAKLNDDGEISLYRDIELQYCQEYLDELFKVIGIKMR